MNFNNSNKCIQSINNNNSDTQEYLSKLLLVGLDSQIGMYLNAFNTLANIYILCSNIKEKTTKIKNYLIDINDEKIYEIDVIIILSEKIFTKELIDKISKINKKIFIFSINFNYNLICNNNNIQYFKNIHIPYIKEILNKNSVIKFDKTNINNLLNNSSKKSKKIINTNDTSNISQIVIQEINKEYHNFCCSNLSYIYDLELPIIHKEHNYEAVFIEYRCLPHIELLIRNCIYKLSDDWSHTIICGNLNYNYITSIVNKIGRDIKIININHNNLTQNEYNNLLLSKKFWNLLTGEKILIYQEDTFIFKNNINDFLEWDYIGAPFRMDCIEGNNVGNGGLSLRTRVKMLEVLDNLLIDKININDFKPFIKKYMKLHNLDNIPEDVYFSTVLQKKHMGKVADFETAKKFSCETIFTEDSFGMHAMWHGCLKWKDHITKYIHNNCNDKNYKNDNILDDIEIIELETLFLDNNNNYLNNINEYSQLTCKSKSEILSEPKEEFRYLCYHYSNYFCSIYLPIIKQNSFYEAILIEYRCLPHLECLIRNSINKLGSKWSQTIVCGKLNYGYILNIVNNINRDIKIIKTEHENMNQNNYNNMLLTPEFWSLFYGEKLLIYQEDTFIFDTNINNFIDYDYVGAPWPKDLEINEYNVGNGGFSLRTKSIMIKILNNNCNPQLSQFVINYKKKHNLDKCPEDVFFTTSMIQYKIGILSDYEIAKTFSVETIDNSHCVGGHNFWFACNNWKIKMLKTMTNYTVIEYSCDYFIIINKKTVYISEINTDKLNIYKNILDKSLTIKYIITYDGLDSIIFLKKTNFEFQINFESIINNYNSNEKLILKTDIIDLYDINFLAIYFPQYHRIPENDLFWGKGFTEWTLLKPYPKILSGKNNVSISIMKPHSDIGYYDLNENYINKQIEMANKYEIDAFMVYHYWFGNCHKVMYKPLEHIIKKKFCLCWANEPWSKRWDGKNNEVLLNQTYDNFDKMIEYLYQYFKCENYIRDNNGNIIYFIYNYTDIGEINFNKLQTSWSNYLSDKNMKIRYIFSSSFVYNDSKLFDNLDMYLFEPLENNINRFRNNDNTTSKNDFNYYYVNYKNIINYYKNLDIKYLKNKIQGVCLNWNNCVRRKNLKFLYVDNYSTENLKELLTIQVSNIILKDNYYNSNSLMPNLLIINAWNEWNEQAILEPNDETGYSNLETIKTFKENIRKPLITFKENIRKPLITFKENILFIDINYDNKDSGGVVYSLSVLKKLLKKYCVYFHPNYNKYTNFYKKLEYMGIKILIAKDIMNLVEWKKYDFKKIITSRALNHYYYDRLKPIFSDATYYLLTHDLVHLRDSNITKEKEIEILSYYDKCFMISKYEIEYLINNNFDRDKLIYLPIALSQKKNNYNSYNTSNIFFLGSCHEPNIEGLNMFYDYFLEIVKKEPTIMLYIYGNICDKFNKSHKNIIKCGFVEDLDKNLLQHRLFISPLISGAGIKIKIMDNLNLGIPIIGTTKSIEGIDLIDGETYYNLDFNNNKDDYVCKFIEIYKNFENLNEVSKKSKEYFINEFSDEKIDMFVL
jgi:hypothetical protein